jgi:hypothetical protein
MKQTETECEHMNLRSFASVETSTRRSSIEPAYTTEILSHPIVVG